MQDENAKLCFIFRSVHSVLYFPLKNIVPEILLRIRCNKPVKVLRYARAQREILYVGEVSGQI